jgi:hypothetical protein
VVVRSSANSSYRFDGRGERMSWSIVARNRRHVHFDVKPVGAPVFRQVRFAAGHNLDSRKPFPRVLPAGVESVARIVCFVVLTVVELDNVRHED